MAWRNTLPFLIILTASLTAGAQSIAYGLGAPITAKDTQRWDPVNIEGKELPPGSGTAAQGAKIFEAKCQLCHGPKGRDGQAPALVLDNPGHPKGVERHRFVTAVPFAPVVWDYINRAMPLLIGPGTLKPDEVYSLTAFLLYENGVIKANDVMDAKTLPKVKMPNHDNYTPPTAPLWKP